MPSQYGDYFNHDPDAADYDQDVVNEAHPIREGYAALQTWIAQRATNASQLVDLGCGTGNTLQHIYQHHAQPQQLKAQAVDLSANMLELAKEKLAAYPVQFEQADLLDYVLTLNPPPLIDSLVSAYALHHLTPAEKNQFFQALWQRLKPGGQALMGDLMFENQAGKAEMYQRYPRLVPDFEDEFFWDLDACSAALSGLGFTLSTTRFSDLSWGIQVVKPL